MTSTNIPLKKIGDNIWEIPKSFNPNMNVPCRIYADESLLDKMKQDLTLQQCVNVAQLPGILKFSITMPDGHQGYGFPIGGVAAFDAESGVISPGGVGYDINCLPPGSMVLTPYGYRIPIEQAASHQKVISIDSGRAVPSKLLFEMRKRDGPLLKITTRCGLKIRATGDHPILTPHGMVEARALKVGDKVATHPFEGVEFEKPPQLEILGEKDFSPKISKELKRRGLLPLRTDNMHLSTILKLLGYFIGVGSFDGKKTYFYGSKEGIEQICEDLRSLGYSPSQVYTRERIASIRGKIFRGTNSIHVSALSFRQLLEKLGAPKGKKTKSAFFVPKWLMILPKWLQRSFLAGYFGAAMSKPQTVNGYNFEPPVVSCTMFKSHSEIGIKFLNQLRAMLRNFGVEVCRVRAEDLGDRVRLKLQLSESPESLLNLWSKIGYAYSPEKQRLALAAISWLRWKLSVIPQREEIAVAAKLLRSSGSSADEIVEFTCNRTWINRTLIERSLYEERATPTSPAHDFPKFEEWAHASSNKDIVWDDVIEIAEEPFFGEVYDITVDNSSHNFVADCFVVSNCGVRLVLTNLEIRDVRPQLSKLVDTLFDLVPSGLGSKGGIRLDPTQQDRVLDMGVEWAIQKGYGWDEDARRCEEGGCMKTADHSKVSSNAKSRGASQLGTLGSGNHFLEVQMVEKIFDQHAAKTFGIEHEGQVVVMIHSGSRGLGHQVCSDYLHVMEHAVAKYKIKIPDRELACAPAESPEAKDYFAAMSAACNYAWANRQCITHWTREAFQKVFKSDPERLGMRLLYDVAHNLAKREEHVYEGKKRILYVHRKGATRAFPAGRPEIPQEYQNIGQPVIIPGSMGTASYLLVGAPMSLELSWGSTAHGAGRYLSREAAIKKYWGSDVKRELENKGIHLRAANIRVIAEEAPGAYKDVDKVAEVSHQLGIAMLVARMVPIGVTKG
jgi:tRNA-splicing ligase RtcB